jgi:hypothetical protein
MPIKAAQGERLQRAVSGAVLLPGARWAKENDLDIAVLNTGHGALDQRGSARH